MADHVYKPTEVPKGQRWQYFLDYYKKPCIVILLIIAALISVLKVAVFDPKPDLTILGASLINVEYTQWDEAVAAMAAMPFDYNQDGQSLVEINHIRFDIEAQETDPEAYLAWNTRLVASIDSAESALQIIDEETLGYFENQGLLGTYSELPDPMGHAADEVIKIPLQELAPFRSITGLPEGLFMTLRPRELMHLGNSEKKRTAYENQLHTLQVMMAE